jgi:hypothetical protein
MINLLINIMPSTILFYCTCIWMGFVCNCLSMTRNAILMQFNCECLLFNQHKHFKYGHDRVVSLSQSKQGKVFFVTGWSFNFIHVVLYRTCKQFTVNSNVQGPSYDQLCPMSNTIMWTYCLQYMYLVARIMCCSNSLRAGWLRVQTQMEARFSRPVQTGSKPHQASCTMGTGSLSKGYSSWVRQWPPPPFSAEVGDG